ncbi:unnamed protein product [marine sediment metagenome]|uniref:Uncharacterized protein n=1 Tax=marine sediment metagenome TaxID=412755 RepID=X1E5R0_9ZZZZ
MGDIYEAKWQVSVDGVVSTVNMHYEQDQGGDSPTICESVARAIDARCSTQYRACLAKDARIEALYVRKITGQTRPAWQFNFSEYNGTSVGTDAISAQNCLLINLRNSAGLLKRSGRWFISGAPKVDIEAGIWRSVYLTVPVAAWLATVINIPVGPLDGWSGSLRVLRTYIDGVKQEPPVPITVDVVDATVELGTIMKRKGIFSGSAPDLAFPV